MATPPPALNYNMLNEQKLKKKLADMGIPSDGPKTLLVRRHQEWADLVRANCDSKNPKDFRTLLRQLDEWERAQGAKAQTHRKVKDEAQDIRHQSFDRDGWSDKHKDNFEHLIAAARSKVQNQKDVDDQASAVDLTKAGN